MTDWLKVGLKFSEASRQEATTAEENVMRLLMQEIEDLLKETTRQEPRRIWTLHKIVGNQVNFYKSSNFQRSANHRELVKSTSEGLIGKAIKQDEDVITFKDANLVDGYVQGWDDCQAELIALVRDSRNNAIGVINIESNVHDDFYCNELSDSQDKEIIIQHLKQIVSIASNHISLIFRNQSLIEGEKSSINLIKASIEAPMVSRAVLQEVVGNLAHWLNDRVKLLRVILYLTEPGNTNKYKRLTNIDLFIADTSNNTNAAKNGISSELQYEEKMKALFGFGLRKFSKSNIVTIFGDEFAASLLAGSKEPGIYFIASDVPGDQSIVAKYFVGLILAEPIINNFEIVQTFFDVAKNIVAKHLRYKFERYSSLQNRATIEIYKTVLQEESLRVALNQIATQIVNETEGRFCMVYLVAAADEAYHSRHKFYLGGAGKGTVDFADIRFDQNASIVSYVLNNQQDYYHPNFFKSKESRHLLDRPLKEQGLEKPEVFAFPLKMQEFSSSSKVGVILLFRENSDEIAGTNRPSEEQVKLRLSDWTEYLSSAIYKKQRQTDLILAETFKKLAEKLPGVVRQEGTDQIISQLQTQVTSEVLCLWREIISPAIFVIYKENESRIEILDRNILPRMTFEPPKFKRGQGLTGSVIGNEEVYEPFIEDFEPYTEDFEYPKSEADSTFPTPDRVCKIFWDSVLGDKRRMYYGRHVALKDGNYILLIVGVRQNQFLPYLGYKLAHNLTDVVRKFLEELIDSKQSQGKEI